MRFNYLCPYCSVVSASFLHADQVQLQHRGSKAQILLKKANCWHCAEVNAAGCMAKCVQASLTFTFEDLRKVPSSVFLLGASSLVTFLLPKKWRLANPQPDFLRMWMWWRSWSEVRQPWLPPTLASSRPWAWTWMPRGWMAVRSYKSSWLSATSELWRLWRGLGPRTGMDHNILRVDRWWRNSNRDHRIILYIWCDRFLMLVSKTSSICSYCGSFDVFWCLALLLNHLDSTRCDLICQSFLISKCDPHST